MSDEDDDRRRRNTLWAALFVVAFGALALWIADAIVDRQKLERCVYSGRKTCADVPQGARPAP